MKTPNENRAASVRSPLRRFLESMREHIAAAAALASTLIVSAVHPIWMRRYESHGVALDVLTPVLCALIVLYLFSIRQRLGRVVYVAPLALLFSCLALFATYNLLLERSCKIRSARELAMPYEATSDVAAEFLQRERKFGVLSTAAAADKFHAQWIEPQLTQTEILHLPGPIPGELALVVNYVLVFATAESAFALIVLAGFTRSRRPRDRVLQ